MKRRQCQLASVCVVDSSVNGAINKRLTNEVEAGVRASLGCRFGVISGGRNATAVARTHGYLRPSGFFLMLLPFTVGLVCLVFCGSHGNLLLLPPSPPHHPHPSPPRPQVPLFVARLVSLSPSCRVAQLFMVPALRKAILEARLPRRSLQDFPRELVGRRVAVQWETGGSVEAYVHSYNERSGTCRRSLRLCKTLLYADV